jgi:hypothetical protein
MVYPLRAAPRRSVHKLASTVSTLDATFHHALLHSAFLMTAQPEEVESLPSENADQL